MDRRQILGGGAITVAGVAMARELFTWAFGKALDWAAKRLPEAATMSGEIGVFDGIGLILAAVGLFLVVSGWRSKKRHKAVEPVAPIVDRQEEAPIVDTSLGSLRPEDLYHGALHVSLRDEGRLFELVFRCYNGSSSPVGIIRVEGAIRPFAWDEPDSIGALPRPSQSHVFDVSNIPPKSEFLFPLEQRLTSEITERLDRLDTVGGLKLDMSELAIYVAPVGKADQQIKLPIWTAARVRRGGDWVQADQISVGTASVGLG